MNDSSQGKLTKFTEFPQKININTGNCTEEYKDEHASEVEMVINSHILKGLKPIVMVGRLVGVFNRDILSSHNKNADKK